MNRMAIAFFIICTIFTVPAKANSSVENLSTCLANSTTGKDRKDAVKWIFVAISTHPEIEKLVNITSETRDKYHKLYADLVTRLLTVDCKNEARAAMEKNGTRSLEKSFESLGVVAMQELMNHHEVKASMSKYASFLNKEKLKVLYREQ